MDHIPPKDILQYGLNTYKLFGEYMSGSSVKLILYRAFNCFIFVLNLIFTVGSFAKAQGEEYMKSMEGCITIIHTFVKYIWFIYYEQDIINLLDKVKIFWDHRKCGSKLHADITKVHQNVEKVQRFIVAMTSCTITIFLLRPVIGNKQRFIFYCWIPYDSLIWETICLWAQYYFTLLIIPVIFACDAIYFSFSIHVISQLRLLNWELENMPFGSCNERIKNCLKHHQLILEIFDSMKTIFFWLLLFHYFVTMITGCSQMYMSMVGNVKSIDLVTTMLYIGSLLIQFAYYAFPAEAIVSELQYISTTIYMSHWLERSSKQKKWLLFMMMRSNRQKYLSVGGFMDLNVDAFGSIIRKIFSFCAVLRNVLSD